MLQAALLRWLCQKSRPRQASMLRSQHIPKVPCHIEVPVHLERRLYFLHTCALCQDCVMVPILCSYPPLPTPCLCCPTLPVLPGSCWLICYRAFFHLFVLSVQLAVSSFCSNCRSSNSLMNVGSNFYCLAVQFLLVCFCKEGMAKYITWYLYGANQIEALCVFLVRTLIGSIDLR